MKALRILFISSLFLATGCSNVNHFGRYDILCSGGFDPVRLKEELKSPDGVALPAGTIVYLRNCQYGNQAYLPVVIEPGFAASYEPTTVPERGKPHYPLFPASADVRKAPATAPLP